MYWFLIMIWTILIILVNTLWFYVVNLYYILVTCLLENAVILRGEFTDWSCWFSCRLTYLEFTVKQVWNDFDFVSVHVVTSTSFYCMFLGTIWLHFVTKLEQTDLSWFIANKIQVMSVIATINLAYYQHLKIWSNEGQTLKDSSPRARAGWINHSINFNCVKAAR